MKKLLNLSNEDYAIVIAISKRYYVFSKEDYSRDLDKSELEIVGFENETEFNKYLEQEVVNAGESEGTISFQYKILKSDYLINIKYNND